MIITGSQPYIPLFRPDGNIRALDRIEQDVIRFALEHYDGNVGKAALWLGIARSTLYRKLEEMGL